MGRLGRITRRAFLVTSVAVAGGVALGVWQAKRDLPNPLEPDEGEIPLNSWVIITSDGYAIVTPRAEMGQGVHTTLAALVAEELEVPWEEIRTLHGPAAQAYFNGALLRAAVPWPDYEITGWKEWLADATFVLPKMLGLQVTGGSTSMLDGFEKMRLAGAAAREMLKTAAARRWGLEVEDVRAENGKVIAPDGRAIPYFDLAAQAADIEPPSDLELKPRSEWRYLGHAMPRVDMVPKITGRAGFGIDVRLPGMKFATVRRNPKLGGRMLDHDPAPALAMPGVEKVIALEDGVVVVASNTWLAMRAAEAVAIEWEESPHPPTTPAQIARLEAAFETEPDSVMRDEGDAVAVIARAPTDKVVEAEYRVPWLAHATMEPMNATALLEEDVLTIWAPNQAPTLIKAKAAALAGVPEDQVEVHTTYLGGGFGRRAETDFALIAVEAAKAMPGVPVQVSWSREEDMTHDFYRPAAMARMKGVVNEEGIVAFYGRVSAPALGRQAGRRLSGVASPGPDRMIVEGMFDQPYGIADYRVEGYAADLDIPVGFWRSVGNSYNGFFHECFIDELARAAGRDPLEHRIELVRRVHEPSAKVLEAVAEMSGWGRSRREGVGRGVAFTYSFGTPVAQVIEIGHADERIRLLRAWIACDPGIALDPLNVEAQMISGMVYGLSAAIFGEIGFEDGAVIQSNFPDYEALRMSQMPQVEVRIVEAGKPLGGIGEPGTPPSMPALANAVFDLTGKRIRTLPLGKFISFA